MGRNPIVCPAGLFIREGDRGPGVHCKIERQFIPLRENPRSVIGYCAEHYTECPTWIAAKEGDPAVAEAQGKPVMTNCSDCEGHGIVIAVTPIGHGILHAEEEPCDACRGSGKVTVRMATSGR